MVSEDKNSTNLTSTSSHTPPFFCLALARLVGCLPTPQPDDKGEGERGGGDGKAKTAAVRASGFL